MGYSYETSRWAGLFGLPGEGIHSYRIADVAVVDLGLTAGAAAAVNYFWFPRVAYLVVLFVLLLIGVVVHRWFGVNTAFDRLLFGEAEKAPAAKNKKAE